MKSNPRVLLLSSNFLLYSDIEAAFETLETPYHILDMDGADSTTTLCKNIRDAAESFRPDFALTINHLGVDAAGELLHTMEDLQLPLASWFVDSPELTLHDWHNLRTPLAMLFTIDADSVEPLREAGNPNVAHLPLGTNPVRFNPARRLKTGNGVPSTVCFVGNTWMREIGQRLKAARPTRNMLLAWRTAARIHQNSPRRPVADILRESFPEAANDREQLPTFRRQMYDVAVAFESTRSYRLDCVSRLLPFSPLVIGNPTWKIALPEDSFHWMESAAYNTILPTLYPLFDINFNCTCPYFTAAVNQRVFDVPAAGAFVLSDHRKAMESLFEQGTECATYSTPEEIPELVEFYLRNSSARTAIAKAARRRVLLEHTYEHRIRSLLESMTRTFGR